MRNFQSFTLAMMMMTMPTMVMMIIMMMTGTACAAPTPPAQTSAHPSNNSQIINDMKARITCEARKLETNLKQAQAQVRVHFPVHQATCVKEFFCLAEKSLSEVKENLLHVEALKRQLHQYNKQSHNVTCHLDSNVEISLKRLLENIIRCSTKSNVSI